MRNQEIYDTVRKHLLTQYAKAEDYSGGSCVYRGPNDTKCAVGCLIADEDYTEEMEGPVLGASNHPDASVQMVWKALHKKGITQHNYNLLRQLQGIHDSTDVPYWEFDLDKCAKAFKLKVNG